jgi:hypothetical protein
MERQSGLLPGHLLLRQSDRISTRIRPYFTFFMPPKTSLSAPCQSDLESINNMKTVSLNLACVAIGLAITALSGCAGKESQKTYTGLDTSPVPIEADNRSYHSSWGHSGRGGAAVRKPAYQHVLATYDRLDVPAGRLYPSLDNTDGLAVSASVYSINAIPEQPPLSMEGKPPCSADFRVIASAREMTDDYVRVRNKLCAGTDRLTFEEWEVLVNGTPKGVPAGLKVSPSPRIQPLSRGSDE